MFSRLWNVVGRAQNLTLILTNTYINLKAQPSPTLSIHCLHRKASTSDCGARMVMLGA